MDFPIGASFQNYLLHMHSKLKIVNNNRHGNTNTLTAESAHTCVHVYYMCVYMQTGTLLVKAI